MRLQATAGAAAWTALEGSSLLAARRAAHSAGADAPLFADPYAEALAGQVARPAAFGQGLPVEFDVIATRYIDDNIMTAVSLVNMDLRDEYRQVVLLGCGMDTRPFRLPWPAGTVLFCVAPSEVHQTAEAALKQQGARVPRGCLLRRVSVDLAAAKELQVGAQLERAGFRADRLSVWALQGLRHQGVDVAGARALLAEVSCAAAYDSIVLGELPPCSAREAGNLLGEAGILGTTVEFGLPQADFGVWPAHDGERGGRRGGGGGDEGGGEAVASPPTAPSSTAAAMEAEGGDAVPRLFCGQHKRMSLAQVQTYDDHVAAAEDADEDFFGNFS